MLCNDFAGIEFNKHSAVCLDFFYRYRESKVIQKQELEFEVVELRQW